MIGLEALSDVAGSVSGHATARHEQLAIFERRHLRSVRVLCLADGSPITRDRVIKAIRAAERAA